eukprot:GHVU01220411.1.p2 GENE.GHVU01220411.1~~GHVU01220411.1.p2  ORF type:complete len:280 (+),score=47.99 GHVU01220411.1:117-956(+)
MLEDSRRIRARQEPTLDADGLELVQPPAKRSKVTIRKLIAKQRKEREANAAGPLSPRASASSTALPPAISPLSRMSTGAANQPDDWFEEMLKDVGHDEVFEEALEELPESTAPPPADAPSTANAPSNANAPSDADAPSTADAPSNANAPSDADAPSTADAPSNANAPPATDAPSTDPNAGATATTMAVLMAGYASTAAIASGSEAAAEAGPQDASEEQSIATSSNSEGPIAVADATGAASEAPPVASPLPPTSASDAQPSTTTSDSTSPAAASSNDAAQ